MKFSYKGRDKIGKLVRGSVEAENKDEAVKRILAAGHMPVDIETGETKIPNKPLPWQAGRPRLDDLADFLRRFSELLEAGIPLVRALQIIEERTSKPLLKEAVGRVLGRVQDGVSLSAAVSAEPGIFPAYWPGLFAAGEMSGQLKSISMRLSQLTEKELETRSRLLSGAIYPLIILFVGIMTVFVLLTFVVPKLGDMFADMGQRLPLITKVLLSLSGILVKTWGFLLALIIMTVLGIRRWLSTAAGKLVWEHFVFRVPFWGEFLKTDDTERLARTLGVLLESGVETVGALECAAQTLKREIFKSDMKTVADAVRQGAGLSRAFATTGIFEEEALNMIHVGEESGKGHQGFLQWAQLCDRRLERMTKTATALIEPALILLIGGMVAAIVMALLLPIFEMSLGMGS